MPSCPVCGAAVGDGYNYCTECGTDLTETRPEPGGKRSEVVSEEPIRSTGWHKVIIGSTAGWILLFFGANSLPVSVFGLLFLLCWPLLPIAIYIDSKELNSQTGWPKYRWAYILSSAVWFVSFISGLVYLWKRHQRSNSDVKSGSPQPPLADEQTHQAQDSKPGEWEDGVATKKSSEGPIADSLETEDSLEETDHRPEETEDIDTTPNTTPQPETTADTTAEVEEETDKIETVTEATSPSGPASHNSKDSDQDAAVDGDPERLAKTTTESVSSGEFANLSAFQRDTLFILSGLDTPKGLEVKSELGEYYDEEINHGRLYPNLDTLVELGLVEKIELDKRTNGYELTELGRDHLQARLAWENRAHSMLAEMSHESSQRADLRPQKDKEPQKDNSENQGSVADQEEKASEMESSSEEPPATEQDTEEDSPSGLLDEMAEEFGVTEPSERDTPE